MAFHPVLQLMHSRLADGGRPGERNDRARLGLAIEGGGMRGVVSAGMLMELAESGLRHVFDAVFGASAGAINGAYFTAAKPQPGIGLYQHVNNSEFINLGRLAGDKPILNLDYLFSLVSSGPQALDLPALLESPQEFRAVATSLERLCPVALGKFRSPEELLLSLRASSSVPFMTGSPLRFRGDVLIDGSVLEAVPIPSAVRDGCTHILALLSKPLQGQGRTHPAVKRRLTMVCLETIRPGLGAAYQSASLKRAEQMRCYGKPNSRPPGPPYVLLVEPTPLVRTVGRLEKSLPKLVAGAYLGRFALRRHLDNLLNRAWHSPAHGNA